MKALHLMLADDDHNDTDENGNGAHKQHARHRQCHVYTHGHDAHQASMSQARRPGRGAGLICKQAAILGPPVQHASAEGIG